MFASVRGEFWMGLNLHWFESLIKSWRWTCGSKVLVNTSWKESIIFIEHVFTMVVISSLHHFLEWFLNVAGGVELVDETSSPFCTIRSTRLWAVGPHSHPRGEQRLQCYWKLKADPGSVSVVINPEAPFSPAQSSAQSGPTLKQSGHNWFQPLFAASKVTPIKAIYVILCVPFKPKRQHSI